MSAVTETLDTSISPTELAHNLESLPLAERAEAWLALSQKERSEALPYLHDEIKIALLDNTSADELVQLAENMEASDVADVIDLVSDNVAQEIIDSLSDADKASVEASLDYDEDTVGRWLKRDVIALSANRSVAQVLRYIRTHHLPTYTDQVFIVGHDKKYRGAVALASILQAEEGEQLKELPLIDSTTVLSPEMSLADMTMVFRRKHFISAPVLDEHGTLLGRITADDAISFMQDEADHQFMSMAGLDEEDDLFAPVVSSSKRRAVWLGINLLTAFLASFVIGQFEAVLQEVVALAVLMPVVASMGGIAGSQTLTIVIRGLALDKINDSNIRPLLVKELGVAVLNGILWAVTVGLVAFWWFSNATLGLVIGCAILINLLAAAFSGLLIPVALEKLKLDPALSGSVVLTTLTDVIGFLSFLGMGAWLLV
ncbi:magnesium transporter MgtE [Arenicella chitinivorans]|uniref:Magnesium transporter MgtE n=1 Tax=Arenicella chitinivorans TaxID=1329800 RepID=A0A918VJK8_9GAMM|nr:magnesium transporter [Arenicella chitinivorans]GHA06807.1 magnesium transporter MgtE [Arenicella chitinivorans]